LKIILPPLNKRFPWIIVGFAITALGLVIMLRSHLGMGPWGALEVGLSKLIGLTVGQVTQLISLALMLFAWALGIRPSMVTFANMLLIGFFMDIFLKVVPETLRLPYQILVYLVGLFVYVSGITLYLISAGGDSGPRESIMLGISKAFSISLRISRVGIDLFALIIAGIVKGPIGAGTILFAFGAGPIIQLFLKTCGFKSAHGKLEKIIDLEKQ
jgi:uncharacterized membrane protein YczE